jgi:predicted RNA methylase
VLAGQHAMPLRRLRRGYLWARRTGSAALLDRPFGLETSREVPLADLGLDDGECRDYEPSGWLGVERILRRMAPGAGDVFMDLGSGKGRVVLQAARHPFGRVVGVELSPALHEIAVANLRSARPRLRCADVELVNADAGDLSIPDDVTVVYLFNPFGGRVFEEFAAALIASADRAPRRIHVVYQRPVEHDRLMATGRFRLVRRTEAWRPTRAWARQAALHEYELEEGPPPAMPSPRTS